MSKSFADGFRTLQAVRDLRVLAALAPVDAQARIAAGIPDGWMSPDAAQGALAALAGEREIAPDIRTETMSAVRLAAALPNEDFPTFLTATMIVLAEALDGGEELEDVQWYWQTFRGHYRAASAPERAAIAQAIRRIGLLSGQAASLPESAPDRTTAPAAALRALFEPFLPRGLAPPKQTAPEGVAVLLSAALASAGAAARAADLWSEHGAALVGSLPPELLAGFRHLYETHDGWAPATDTTIPLFEPAPGVDWPH